MYMANVSDNSRMQMLVNVHNYVCQRKKIGIIAVVVG